jgi:hypothetical protein
MKLITILLFIILTVGVHNQVLLYPDRSSYWVAGGGGSCESPTVLESITAGANSTTVDGVTDTTWQSWSNASSFTGVGDSIDGAYISAGDAGDSLIIFTCIDPEDVGTIIAGSRRAIIWSSLPQTTKAFFFCEYTSQLAFGTGTYYTAFTMSGDFSFQFNRDTGNPYANGNMSGVTNGGSWTDYPTWDWNLKIMGCE